MNKENGVLDIKKIRKNFLAKYHMAVGNHSPFYFYYGCNNKF